MPIIVSGNAFRWFFSEQGTINTLLVSVGLISEPIHWLTDPSLVLFSLVIMSIWIGGPFNFVLLHTALRGVPSELYEVAAIDGAVGWQKLIYITIPVIKPVILVVLMLGTGYTMKTFNLVWITTEGGPANASHLFSTLAYQVTFRQYRFGFGASITNIMTLIILLLVFVYLLVGERRHR